MRKLLILFSFYWVHAQADITSFKHGYPDLNITRSNRAVPVMDSFEVLIDHFSWFNKNKFSMRYMSNNEFFNGSGPMFVFLGGEAPIENIADYLKEGFVYDFAKEVGAYLFMTEHRYYGTSVPNNNLKTSNMGPLQIKQALADIKAFIQDRRNNITALQSSKVVVIGGSYPGNLAMWMREKYPDIVDAAISSSAPLKAKVNFYEYFQVVQTSLGNIDCVNSIKKGTNGVKVRLETNDGVTEIENDFNLCDPLNSNDNNEVQNLFWNIAYPFANAVQYGTIASINKTCQEFMANSTALDDYARLARFVTNNSAGCMLSYQSSIGILRNTGMYAGTDRSWWYQVCTEMGYFFTTDALDQPFLASIPLRFFQNICRDVFQSMLSNLKTNIGVMRTNNVYKALNPQVTKVVSTQGSLDPWSALGLKQDVNDLAPVILINGTSHCADLTIPTTSDPVGLTNARIRIKELITSWIS